MIRREKSKVRHHCAARPKSPDVKASRRTLVAEQVGNEMGTLQTPAKLPTRDEPPMATDRKTEGRDATDLFVRTPDPLVGSTLEHAQVGSVPNLALCHFLTDLGSMLLLGQLLDVSHAEHDHLSNIRSSNAFILAMYCSRTSIGACTRRIHLRVGVLISLKNEYRLRPYLKSKTMTSKRDNTLQ
jgi:hypothetical protein